MENIQLTTREQEVLKRIAQGKSSVEIGKNLFISNETVKTYRKNLLWKLYAENTANLVYKAMLTGILSMFVFITTYAQCISIYVETDYYSRNVGVKVMVVEAATAFKNIGITVYIDEIYRPEVPTYADSITSADILLTEFANRRFDKDTAIKLMLSIKEHGGGVNWKGGLCRDDVNFGPFGVVEGSALNSVSIAREVGYIIGAGELNHPCDGTIMNWCYTNQPTINSGFGDWTEFIQTTVENSCLRATENVNLSGDLYGYVSGDTVTLSGNVHDMTIAANCFILTPESTMVNSLVIQETCKYPQQKLE